MNPLSNKLKQNNIITHFTELEYFTKITSFNQDFRDCTKLETINIPISLTNLGNQTFYNCQSLRYIDAPHVTSGGYQFYHCYELRNLNVVNMVGGSAQFESCRNLTELIIPKCTGAAYNQYYTFMHCSKIVTLDIRSFTHVGYFRQFDGCDALRKIILPDTPPALTNPKNTQLNSSCHLYVRTEEVKQAYLAHSQWSYFAAERYIVSPEDYEE